jgi:ABC-type nitrate/sulfonate/bicarbonate transport system permease component
VTKPSRMRWDLRGFVVPLALVCLAEIVAFAVDLQSDSLAAPSYVVEAAIRAVTDGTIVRATTDTLICAMLGLLVGFLLGLALGVLLGLLPLLNHLLEFTIEAIRPIPSIALIPVALVAFGFGYRMEIAIVAFATMWPTLILSRAAVASIEPRLLEVARMLRLGPVSRTFKIVVPLHCRGFSSHCVSLWEWPSSWL